MPRILGSSQQICLGRLFPELNITVPPDIHSLILVKHLDFQAATGPQKDILENEASGGSVAFGLALARLVGQDICNPNQHLPVGMLNDTFRQC